MKLLDQRDLDSVTWKKLEQYLQLLLTTYRARNDAALTEEQTHFLRGRIAVTKALLALAKPAPDIVIDD